MGNLNKVEVVGMNTGGHRQCKFRGQKYQYNCTN